MQQSSLEFFCEECGAANAEDATHCIACSLPLTLASVGASPSPVVQPVKVTPAPVLEVLAGSAQLPVTPVPAGQSVHRLEPGTMLQNRYCIGREIGQGGYSTVYQAMDMARRKRLVAIKQISLHNLTSRQMIEATETFNREKRLLPQLKHPGIPKFYSHFTDSQHWYLVMEYIPGCTLEDYLQKLAPGGYCSVKETLQIGLKLVSILEYLHQWHSPIIFRDVKPANIMITPDKKVYLIDFGIARTYNPKKSKDTTPLGSPGYAAPEQYGKAQSDARTDIYGLGATLQTMLTGRDPLDLPTQLSLSPKPMPRHVQVTLEAMMNPLASRRLASMAMVKHRLNRALARIYRWPMYLCGLLLGLGYFLAQTLFWDNIDFFFSLYHYFPIFLFLNGLIPILLIAGAVVLFSFLFTPSKRYLTLGFLTIVLFFFLHILIH